MAISLDFSRRPNNHEMFKFPGRLQRLERPGHFDEIEKIRTQMPGAMPRGGLVLRDGFSYRKKPVSVDASDRKAPPPELRPSATRVMSSRGAALRLELMLLAVTQANRKAGDRASLRALRIGSVGSSDSLGWSDLVAADAVNSHSRDVHITARVKRGRTVRTALQTLSGAGLVAFPDPVGVRGRYENFTLLDERGTDEVGEEDEYRVPRQAERTFSLPAGFITNGWVHVLEDAEIALLLMTACGKGAWPDGGLLAMPSDIRLLHYGLHRDSYSAARKTLDWFGLLKVEEPNRRDDGRAEQGELLVHRLGLIADGFDEPGPQRVAEVLRHQMARR